mgnify:CR=1 FL=1
MTTEEKARAYAEKRLANDLSGKALTCDKSVLLFNAYDIKHAYEDGATEALASQWRDPKVELPEDGEYVLISSDRGIEPSVWNEHHQCWDDAEGDDYMYSKEYVKAWMSIPPLKGGDE